MAADESGSIDQAINSCGEQLKFHKNQAMVWQIAAISAIIAGILVTSYNALVLNPSVKDTKPEVHQQAQPPKGGEGDKKVAEPKPTEGDKKAAEETGRAASTYALGVYIFIAFAIVVLGVCVSIYRFHLVEYSRTHHFIIGLRRIRIAANNSPDGKGFGSEVRVALTEGAFTPLAPGKKEKVESPLPGHPGSDVATSILNKLIDKFELTPKEKGAQT